MEKDVLILCKRCSSEQPIGDMKYDTSGDNLICTSCYSNLYEDAKGERVHQSADEQRVRYYCQSCGFRFSRSIGFYFQGLCFNCGKPSVKKESGIMLRHSKD